MKQEYYEFNKNKQVLAVKRKIISLIIDFSLII